MPRRLKSSRVSAKIISEKFLECNEVKLAGSAARNYDTHAIAWATRY